jgi:hypothetical protein
VADSQHQDFSAVVVIADDVAAIAKIDEPLTRMGGVLAEPAADFRVFPKDGNTLANAADGATRSMRVLRSEKPMKPVEVAQRRRCPEESGHGSGVRNRGRDNFAGFEAREPGIGLVRRGMQSGPLILFERVKGFLPVPLELFFPGDVLLNRFAHEPVRRAAAEPGDALKALLERGIKFDAGG